ncbi:MAG: hypothetical protein IPH75_05360 [bacterium]|nr:hypothetical protein [bacterium]
MAMTLKCILTFLRNVRKRRSRPSTVETIRNVLAREKSHAVAAGRQGIAKEIWCYQQILDIQLLYVQTFRSLSSAEFYSAWCDLEQIEIKLIFLSRHLALSPDKYYLEFIGIGLELTNPFSHIDSSLVQPCYTEARSATSVD